MARLIGRLYAAGYDGRVHVLTDTDGDSIEDTVTPYWTKQGDLLTLVGILPTKEGVYVAARGKIALLKDVDGDGKADVSEAFVSDWERETHNSNTRNDAAGLALDAGGKSLLQSRMHVLQQGLVTGRQWQFSVRSAE